MITYNMIDGDHKLNAQQLYLYSFLCRNISIHNDRLVTITTVTEIHKSISQHIEGRKKKNKPFIIQELLLLKKMGYITYDQEIIYPNDLLNISFTLNKSENDKENGFVRIPHFTFDKFADKHEYWLYVYITRCGKWGKSKSYTELAKLLDVSVSKLKNKIIKNLNKDNGDCPRIYKFSGSYILGDSPKQDQNRYYSDQWITEDAKIQYNKLYDENGEAKYRIIKKWNDNDEIPHPHLGEVTVAELKQLQKDSNWGKRDEKSGKTFQLTYDDYITYRLSKDNHINTRWVSGISKRIEVLKSPDLREYYPHYNWELWEEEYIREIV